MGVEVNPGVIVAAAAAVFFYVRLVRAQRDMLRRLPRAAQEGAVAPPRLLRSWPLFWLGMALVVLGAFAAAGTLAGIQPDVKGWWWVPVAVGFGVLALSV